MVRKKAHYYAEMHTANLFKCGQTLETAKPSERTRILMASKSTYQRFMDYTVPEEDKIAAQREKEVAKIKALEKATYEKTKTWSDMIENIKAARRQELLSKKQQEEREREKFVKDMAEKTAAERVEVVQRAKNLLLRKKPLCRQLERGLLVAECFREREAQIAFQKTIEEMDEKGAAEYANFIKTDVAMHSEQQKQDAEKRAERERNHKMDLKKQIDEKDWKNKSRTTMEMEAGKEEQKRISDDIRMTKEREMQDMLNKRKKLKQFFQEVTEEKKRFESEVKRDDEYEDRALEIYRKSQERIKKMNKSIALKERKEREHRDQIIFDLYSAIKEGHGLGEEEIFEKAVKEKEAIEEERQRARKERERTMRKAIEEYKLQDAALKTKQKQDENNWKAWEKLQRFKRAEYNEQVGLEERKRRRQQRRDYGKELQKAIVKRQCEKKREEALETEAHTNMKAAMERANRRILLYGDEILEESKGVRPLRPIIIAMEECKKEMGLIPRKKMQKPARAERPEREHQVPCICRKPVLADQTHYSQ